MKLPRVVVALVRRTPEGGYEASCWGVAATARSRERAIALLKKRLATLKAELVEIRLEEG